MADKAVCFYNTLKETIKGWLAFNESYDRLEAAKWSDAGDKITEQFWTAFNGLTSEDRLIKIT